MVPEGFVPSAVQNVAQGINAAAGVNGELPFRPERRHEAFLILRLEREGNLGGTTKRSRSRPIADGGFLYFRKTR